MNIKNLFCTPEQGRRLQELVPGLTSTFVWKSDGNLERSAVQRLLSDYPLDYCTPALTLQELRDVVTYKMISDDRNMSDFKRHLLISTAPELAQWIIARLEDRQ